MCRLSAFFGAPICAADLVTRPSRSIITQSFDARERMTGDAGTPAYLNGDGFGLGWYSTHEDDHTPCVYRQARPAWNDPNLGPIAEKVYTGVLFAHVRAASPGLDVSEGTCHPFRHGRYLWMHNGQLGGFSVLRRSLLAALGQRAFDFAVTHGSSDTALCFAVFLNLVEDSLVLLPPHRLRDAVQCTIAIIERAVRQADVREVSLLNFVVSDGQSLVATRYVIDVTKPDAQPASLYYTAGNAYVPDGVSPGGYAMRHTDKRPTLAIVSSEPLTENRADWVSVPRNFCVVLTKAMHILLAPICVERVEPSDDAFRRILTNLSTVKPANSLRSLAQVAGRDALPAPTPVAAGKPPLASVGRNGSLRTASGTLAASPGALYPIRGTVRATIAIPQATVLCCRVLGNLLCVGANDGTIHVWDMATDCALHVVRTGSCAILSLVADESAGLLVVGTSAASVLVFRFVKNASRFVRVLRVSCEGMGHVFSLAVIERRVFAGFSDAGLRVVVNDLDEFVGEEQEYDGEEAVLDDKSAVELPFQETGYPFPRDSDGSLHNGFLFAVTPVLRGRYLVTGCGDGVMRVWAVDEERCVQARSDHAGAILTLVAYEVRHGTMVFSGSSDCAIKVWLWDGDTGFICKRTLRKHKDEVVFLAIAAEKLISGSMDGAVCVWCAETLALLCQYRDNGLKAGVVSVHFNSLFSASGEGNIHVRDIVSTERDLKLRDWSKNVQESEASASTSSSILDGEIVGGSYFGRNVNLPKVEDLGIPEHKVSRLPALSKATPSELLSTPSVIVSEVDDESDDNEMLLPGIANDLLLAPPMSPLIDNGKYPRPPSGSLLEAGRTCTAAAALVPEPERMSPAVFERRLMEDVLRQVVSFGSVSGTDEHRESCWLAARFLGRFLEGMGASVKYVSTSSRAASRGDKDEIPSNLSSRDARSFAMTSDSNPIVLARFAAANPSAKTIALYGHYDVMPAYDLSHWESDPWSLTSKNGYFYGRGATDNKGPIIAMIFAIKKFTDNMTAGLPVNVVLILNGEGESANAGFRECVQKHLHWFDKTALILTSNSYWLGEEKPCLTYGFRGIIDLLVTVTGGTRNLHSGVDGGAIFEPMNDLITILGATADSSGVVCIPGFYDDVLELSAEEKTRLASVDFNIDEYRKGTGVGRFTSENVVELLESRWRKPSMSITSIETSNTSAFFSVVPKTAKAKVSVRFVPDQDPVKLEKAINDHLQFEIRKRRSPNKLNVECVHKGDWWLSDPRTPEFQVAAAAVRSVWDVEPEYVCEGGSMPLFSFLAKALQAPLVQVPLGQSSDGAHLPNERIRATNLFRGKEVFQHIIENFGREPQ